MEIKLKWQLPHYSPTNISKLANPHFWRVFESLNPGSRRIVFYEIDPVTEEGIYFHSKYDAYIQMIRFIPKEVQKIE